MCMFSVKVIEYRQTILYSRRQNDNLTSKRVDRIYYEYFHMFILIFLVKIIGNAAWLRLDSDKF